MLSVQIHPVLSVSAPAGSLRYLEGVCCQDKRTEIEHGSRHSGLLTTFNNQSFAGLSQENKISNNSHFLLKQSLSVQGHFTIQENQSLNLENNQNAKRKMPNMPTLISHSNISAMFVFGSKT